MSAKKRPERKRNAVPQREFRLAPTTGSETTFDQRIDETDRYEMKRRLLNQAATISEYQKCLDGLNVNIPGSIESHRLPGDIRRCVESLMRSPNKY